MSEFQKLMDSLLGSDGRRVAVSGKISRIAGGNADVQAEGLPLLINLPMVRQKYRYDGEDVEGPIYEPGDQVLVVFTGGDLSSGVVVGVIG